MSKDELQNEIREQVWERIAQLLARDVPLTQISSITGVKGDILIELIDQPEIQARRQEILAEQFENDQLQRQGWDFIEQQSMTHVLNYLKHTEDPEYALKAAQVANRAERKKFDGIRGGNAGTVTINLNAMLVERLQVLQQNNQMGAPIGKIVSGKEIDVASIQMIDNLADNLLDAELEVLDALEDIKI